MPAWLRTTDVDSLQSKLANIVTVMLGVLFLEQVIIGSDPSDLLQSILAISPVILALSYFNCVH